MTGGELSDFCRDEVRHQMLREIAEVRVGDDRDLLDVLAMGPKVQAACDFARNTGNDAVIGSLVDITKIIGGTAGTRVRTL